jgi:hypothetical protein
MHVLSMERRVAVVEHLTDGAGVRAASRLTRVYDTSILSLILKLGQGCTWLHNRSLLSRPAAHPPSEGHHHDDPTTKRSGRA